MRSSITTILRWLRRSMRPCERPQQRIADRAEPAATCTPAVAHRLPMLGVDHDRARAQVIGHGPTGHAARRRPLQRLDHLEAVVVRQPDVEEQMDVILRGIDVGDHGLDAGIGVRQQSRLLPPTGSKPLTECPTRNRWHVALRNLRLKRWRFCSGRLRDIRHRGQHLMHATHPATTDVRLAQQKIGDDARPRAR